MERIAVKSMSLPALLNFPFEIKRDLLMFDKIVMSDFGLGLAKNIDVFLKATPDKNDAYNGDELDVDAILELIEALQKLGWIEIMDDIALGQLVRQVDVKEVREFKEVKKNLRECKPLVDTFISEKNRQERKPEQLAYIDSVLNDNYVRIITSTQATLGNDNYFPILSGYESFQRKEKMSEGHILSFVLNQMPVPDLYTSFEQINDFRNNTEIKSAYYRMVNWMNQVSKQNLTRREFEDHYLGLYHDYVNNFKRHKIKTKLARVEILYSVGFEFLSNFAKLNWGDAVKSLFQWRKIEGDLWEAEQKLEGRELAYIYKAGDLT